MTKKLVNKGTNRIVLFNIASTIILQGLAFISGPIFSGALGTDNYGIAAVYLTWVQLGSTVFSLQAAGSIAQARIYIDLDEQERFQSSVLCLSTISYLAFSAITLITLFIASIWISISIPMVIVGLLHGWGLYIVTAMNAKFTYEFKADKNFILSITVSVLTIGLSLYLINLFPTETNYWGRILGQSSVYTVIGIVLLSYMLKTGKTVYNKSYWLFSLPITVPTVFHLLAGLVLNQSDKIMLQGIIDNSAAGIYALACTFSMVLSAVWNAFNNSWVPFYYEYTKHNQIEEMRIHAKNYIELFTVVAMGFVLLAREVFHIYANNAFWAGTDLIPVFSIGYYFVFLYSFPVNYEFYYKKTKTIALVTTCAALCNLLLNYIFINAWGIQGAVIATAIAHGLQFLFHYLCAKRIGSESFPFKMMDFIPGLLIICLTCGFYMITRSLWYVRWGIGFILGIYILYKIIKRRQIF